MDEHGRYQLIMFLLQIRNIQITTARFSILERKGLWTFRIAKYQAMTKMEQRYT